MFRRVILSAWLGLATLIAVVPNVAFAQSYGGWGAQNRSEEGFRDARYDDRRGYDDHGRYYARQRWIAHRRWEQEQRRREWQREHWRGDYDRRDGWHHDQNRWDRGEGY